MKAPIDRDSPEYKARLREVMGELPVHVPVHIAGGPCMKDAPRWHKFSEAPFEVTCEVCRVTIVLVAGEQQVVDGFSYSADGDDIQHALAGEPDPYALKLWEAKKAKEERERCPKCAGAGSAFVSPTGGGRSLGQYIACRTCKGTGKIKLP